MKSILHSQTSRLPHGSKARNCRIAVIYAALGIALALGIPAQSQGREVIYETQSEFNHIQVIDADGLRILSFDGSRETQMRIDDPLQGHFEYIDYFHMPWVWNPNIDQALMIGLGGGSIQRSFLHYYPKVQVDSVEIDAAVVRVAQEYFAVKASSRHALHVADGRKFLEESKQIYDVLLVDAYSSSEGQSVIPHPLVTREFFQLATNHLSARGVLAYNVIGRIQGGRSSLPGSVLRTLSESFPRLYAFPARGSINVVLVATMSPEPLNSRTFMERANQRLRDGVITMPNFRQRLQSFREIAPSLYQAHPVLTDADAPPDGMLRTGF